VNTSLTGTDKYIQSLKRVVAGLLNADVEALEQVAGGRNSQVYRVRARQAQSYALKVYFQHASDQRDRLQTEFESLLFLSNCGVRTVPRPFACDRDEKCALYEWIEGERIGPDQVTEGMIDTAISFVVRLAELRTETGSSRLAKASEACFSGRALVENIRARLTKLSHSEDPALKGLLREEVLPEFEEVVAWSRARLGTSFDDELPLEATTLSPSDFGLHNALQTPGGEIVFLDFEYFGWDDPVKLVSDFLLHPAMVLSLDAKRRFATSVIEYFSASMPIARRLEALYPLFGLKWCTILLNEFLPEHLLRRRFAAVHEVEDRESQSKQLAKARGMLQRIHLEYEDCPYFN
jgi:hypothetical protein